MQERAVNLDADGTPVGVSVRWTVTVKGVPVTVQRTFTMSARQAFDLAGSACAIAHARLIKRLYAEPNDVPAQCEPISFEEIGSKETPALSPEEKRRQLEAELVRLQAELSNLKGDKA